MKLKSIKLIFFSFLNFIEKRLAVESSITTTSTTTESGLDTQLCDHCGNQCEQRSKTKHKRYCSLTCARAAKKSNSVEPTTSESIECKSTIDDTKKIQPTIADEKLDESTINGVADKPEVENILDKWSVTDVYEFIKNLPGFGDYAEDFAIQEIDGQALSLLNDNHLVNTMGMKLGPALKILAKVQSLKVPENPPQ